MASKTQIINGDANKENQDSLYRHFGKLLIYFHLLLDKCVPFVNASCLSSAVVVYGCGFYHDKVSIVLPPNYTAWRKTLRMTWLVSSLVYCKMATLLSDHKPLETNKTMKNRDIIIIYT